MRVKSSIRRRIPLWVPTVFWVLAFSIPLHARNLLRNGALEVDENGNGVADGWYLSSHNDAKGSADLQPSNRGVGGLCQHIAHTNDTPEWVRTSLDGTKAEPDTLYRISGWIKATGKWYIILYEFPEGKDSGYTTHYAGRGEACEWQCVSNAIRTKSSAKSFRVSLVTSGRGEAWFDDIVLENLEDVRTIRAPLLQNAPTVDGDLTDPAWEKAVALQPFCLLDGDGKEAPIACAVQLGMVGSLLYFSWDCAEPDTAGQNVSDPPSWDNDTVEIFLAPDPVGAPGMYAQFAVTPNGGKLASTKRDASGKRFYRDWYSHELTGESGKTLDADAVEWQAGVKRSETGWTVEMAIPLDAISVNGDVGQRWGLQLARSRKIRDLEQNSCWSFTEGETFHRPERFGRLFVPLQTTQDTTDLLLPEDTMPKTPTVVPSPVHMKVKRKSLSLPSHTVGTLFECLEKERVKIILEQALGKIGGTVCPVDPREKHPDIALRIIQKKAGFVCRREDLEPWQRLEAYELDTTRFPCELRAETTRGLICGIQTFCRLAVPGVKGIRFHRAEVRDWPQMKWRGWHLIAPATADAVDEAIQIVDTMAALKMNWLAFQIDSRLQYDRDPELSAANAPTKAQLSQIVRHAENYGIEVIPMTQCWSHFTTFLSKPKYRHLAEIPDPPEDRRRKFWNYCPRNPEAQAFINQIIEEQLECFPNAKYFHVGLDEIIFEPIGVCPRCKDATGGELLAAEIIRLHDFLAAKGLRMCMWGDQLLVEHNGKPPYNTAEALLSVPRDVIIFDWHYRTQEEFPSVAFFKNHGFDVIASGWYEPLNVSVFTKTAHTENILGYGGTTWYGIDRIRDEVRLASAIPLSAEFTWSTGHSIQDLAYRPAEVFQTLYDGTETRDARFLPLDLTAYANQSLWDSERRNGWLGLGPGNDLSTFPTGLQRFAGVPFRVPADGTRQCIMLAEQDDPLQFPEAVLHIPVDTQVKALDFLQTCSRPPRFCRHIYDRAKVNPGEVMRYEIHYADGASREIPLKWNVRISDWNSQLGSAYGKTAWVRKTAEDALARIEVLRWENPRPDIAVEAIDIVSGMSTARPVVIGITAEIANQ